MPSVRVLIPDLRKPGSSGEEPVRGNEKCHLKLVPGSTDQSEGHSPSWHEIPYQSVRFQSYLNSAVPAREKEMLS